MAKPASFAKASIAERFFHVFQLVMAEYNLSAATICQGMPFSEPYISQLKKGDIKTVKPEFIASLCVAYDYSILWIMTGRGEKKAGNEQKTLHERIAQIEKDTTKNREILDEVVVKLLNQILHINITPLEVTKKLVSDAKKRTN